MRALVAALGASAVLLVACGESEKAPSATTTAPTTRQSETIGLTIHLDDGAGHESSGALVCGPGEQRATGDFERRRPALELCRDAAKLTHLLTSKPASRRACTQIYGGPAMVLITGTIGSRQVDRRFTRTNGCRIEEYTQLKPILPPIR